MIDLLKGYVWVVVKIKNYAIVSQVSKTPSKYGIRYDINYLKCRIIYLKDRVENKYNWPINIKSLEKSIDKLTKDLKMLQRIIKLYKIK